MYEFRGKKRNVIEKNLFEIRVRQPTLLANMEITKRTSIYIYMRVCNQKIYICVSIIIKEKREEDVRIKFHMLSPN